MVQLLNCVVHLGRRPNTVCQWNQTNQGNGILFQATFYGKVKVCSMGTIEEKHKT